MSKFVILILNKNNKFIGLNNNNKFEKLFIRYNKENKEKRQEKFEITKLVESFANLAMAINWLPLSTNFKFPNSIVGLLGVTSTIASIVSQ